MGAFDVNLQKDAKAGFLPEDAKAGQASMEILKSIRLPTKPPFTRRSGLR